MRKSFCSYILIQTIFISFCLLSCAENDNHESQPEIAVTNSYLQCAVKDLYGDDTEVFCLAPPGMCPGHFDISPSQVSTLSNCRILLLFDFQEKVESSLAGLKSKGLKTFLIESQPGMCIPDTYLTTCQNVTEILSKEFPEKETLFKQRLLVIGERLRNLGDKLHTEINNSRLAGVKVVSSGHQSDFINWLGLETISTFAGSDSETAFNINDCLNKAKEHNVKFIIANKQEGTYLADSLADRLNVKTVIFSNFPESVQGSTGFDELVQQNISVLKEAVSK